MKLAITGHRPQKLKGFGATEFHQQIQKAMEELILDISPDIILTGMALGVDQWAAEICINHNIPFIACVPFERQYTAWGKPSINKYKFLLNQAKEVIKVDTIPEYKVSSNQPEGSYNKYKMIKRNKYMVDNSDGLLAVCKLGYGGGSEQAVSYAKHNKKLIYRVNLGDIDSAFKDRSKSK